MLDAVSEPSAKPSTHRFDLPVLGAVIEVCSSFFLVHPALPGLLAIGDVRKVLRTRHWPEVDPVFVWSQNLQHLRLEVASSGCGRRHAGDGTRGVDCCGR